LGGEKFDSKRKRYARTVMSLEARRPDHPPESTLCFTSYDLEDVVPHEDDSMVIFVITIGKKVHRVLINQGSSTSNVMGNVYQFAVVP